MTSQVHLYTSLPENIERIIADVSAGFGVLYGPKAEAMYQGSGRQIFASLLQSGEVWLWGVGPFIAPQALLMARIADARGEVMFAHAFCGAPDSLCESLVAHATTELRVHGAKSILGEFVPTDQRDWAPAFASAGYVVVQREIMGRDVDTDLMEASDAQRAISKRHAAGEDAAMAACLIDAYRGHGDCKLHEEVRDESRARGLFGRVISGQAGASDPDLVRGVWRDGICIAVAAGAFAAPGVGFVLQIGVRKEFQGQGIGRRLLHEMLAHFRRYGASRVMLGVTCDNPARHLYLAEGFAHVRPFTSHIWEQAP
ncbi:MAG: GNAT family N-acetyltransferase [Candidatus Hydrogenedens sp.]|nr:GNAT family N-acetyltransferase [Candidatus Hydrogenedens sp.]